MVSLSAAVVPDAKSNRPATGLATVPTAPFNIPPTNPCYNRGQRSQLECYIHTHVYKHTHTHTMRPESCAPL